ncbi:MAG: hypothetical protein GXN96_01660 [Aquificae bacterium]|nr:hypothetical protein [Aquificota bacterium]
MEEKESILSPEEISLLMETLEKKRVEVRQGVQPFDFDQLERVDPTRYLRLEQFLESLTGRFEEVIKRTVVSPCSVQLTDRGTEVASRVLSSLPPPVILVRENLESKGELYFLAGAKFAYALISVALGGQPADLSGKPFSRLELNILRRVFSSLCEACEELWNEFFSLKASGHEMRENLLEIDVDDEYYIARFSVEFGEFKDEFFLLIPLYLIRELKEELNVPRMSPEERKAILEAFSRIPLSLEVVVARKKDRLGRVLSLREGSILLTDRKVTDDVEVLVQGKLKFLGTLGETEGKRAVRINREI